MLCPVQIIYTVCFISAMQMIMFPQSVREWDHGTLAWLRWHGFVAVSRLSVII